VIATNEHSLIAIGGDHAAPRSTNREEVQLEIERARIYGDELNLTALPPRSDDECYPPIVGALAALDTMRVACVLRPELLRDLGTLGLAAKATTVEVLIHPDNQEIAGFAFAYLPGEHDDDQPGLFDGDDAPVSVRGLLNTTKSDSDSEEAASDTSDPAERHYDRARQLVVEFQDASITMLQNRLGVDRVLSMRILDLLEQRGVVSPQHGRRKRSVIEKPSSMLTVELGGQEAADEQADEQADERDA
jgi:S-DNA-T family DNA segregation ATPase FtsK/SpoIIIE